MRNKINFLEQIEVKVKDVAEEITCIAVIISSGEIKETSTIFTVDDVKGFNIGDEVYLTDRNGNSVFTRVIDITNPDKLEVNGDQMIFLKGALMKKTDAGKYLDEAIAVYSKYRPQERMGKKLIKDPVNIFDLPADWENGFSIINSIVYPVDLFPVYILPKNVYEIFLDDGNIYKLRFTKNVSTAYIINYIISHSFNDSNPPVTTIPDSDFYCICNIAAGYYLLALANRYGQNVNPTLGSSTINYDDKSEKYIKLAGDMLLQAASWLGVNGLPFRPSP